ncbi:hypothetical protein CA51_05270 [Rosistilla oblonga]|uniref:hypothetical protein n=1 Tax=Rosistilla oblonga TaxID=2527990 RepID=UPI00118A35AB|nr:hypothetical protein [Rosistilla oblonga]QDV10677.1 hypothetical protein CA51_05270 [Rosistilla oblonga]
MKFTIVVAVSFFVLLWRPELSLASDYDAVVAAVRFFEKSQLSGQVDEVEPLLKKGATRKRGKPGSLIEILRREQEHIRKTAPMRDVRLREIYVVREDEQEQLKDRTLRYMRAKGKNVTDEEADVPADVIAKAYGLTENRTVCMLFYELSRGEDAISVNLVLVALEEIEGKFLVAHVWDD